MKLLDSRKADCSERREVAAPASSMNCLLIVSDSDSGLLKETLAKLDSDASVEVVNLGEDPIGFELPGNFHQIDRRRFADPEVFRTDFLRFLNDWPEQQLDASGSFNNQFQHRRGYKVWWTGVAVGRIPSSSFTRTFKMIWWCGHVLHQGHPERVILVERDSAVADSVRQWCVENGAHFEQVGAKNVSSKSRRRSASQWSVRAIARQFVLPIRRLIKSSFAFWMAKPSANTSGFGGSGDVLRDNVILSSRLYRYFKPANDAVQPVFWRDFLDAMRQHFPSANAHVFVSRFNGFSGARWIGDRYNTGWRWLNRIPNSLPVPESSLAMGVFLRDLPRQIAAIVRFWRLERKGGLSSSLMFNGMGVASALIPVMRESVASMLEWQMQVFGCKKGMQRCEGAGAMLITEEFYACAMQELAAARELGIKTVGIQHGTIMPDHYIYTVPRGHLEGAPVPDFFAAYSEYAKETLTEVGSFPAERVWVTGSPRFDRLVTERMDRRQACQILELPSDKKIVLVTTQTAQWFDSAVQAIFEALATRMDVVVCVKPHPKPTATPVARLREYAESSNAGNVRFFEDRFELLVNCCDVLVSSSSTTVLEAILAGKHAICINFSGEPDRYPYVVDGGALPARSSQELKSSLEVCLSDGYSNDVGREAFLRRHAGPSASGDSGRVFADRIRSLFDSRKGSENA